MLARNDVRHQHSHISRFPLMSHPLWSATLLIIRVLILVVRPLLLFIGSFAGENPTSIAPNLREIAFHALVMLPTTSGQSRISDLIPHSPTWLTDLSPTDAMADSSTPNVADWPAFILAEEPPSRNKSHSKVSGAGSSS